MTELGRKVLIGLAVLAVILVIYVALPFAGALLMAAVLAAAFSPWFERAAEKLHQQRSITAGLFVTAVVFALVLPVGAIVLGY